MITGLIGLLEMEGYWIGCSGKDLPLFVFRSALALLLVRPVFYSKLMFVLRFRNLLGMLIINSSYLYDMFRSIGLEMKNL